MLNHLSSGPVVLGAVAAMLPPASLASANLISNGSFEVEPIAANSQANIAQLADWSSVGSLHLLNHNTFITAFDGNQYVNLGGNGASNGTLEQAFATTPGVTYTANFMVANIQGSSASTQELTASAFDAANLATALASTATNVTGTDWFAGNTLTFLATGSQTILQFSDTIGTVSQNMALDAVVVVPEPAAAAMLGLMGGMALRRRA